MKRRLWASFFVGEIKKLVMQRSEYSGTSHIEFSFTQNLYFVELHKEAINSKRSCLRRVLI